MSVLFVLVQIPAMDLPEVSRDIVLTPVADIAQYISSWLCAH